MYGGLAFFPLAVVLFPTGVGERSSGQSHLPPVFTCSGTLVAAAALRDTCLLLSSKLHETNKEMFSSSVLKNQNGIVKPLFFSDAGCNTDVLLR